VIRNIEVIGQAVKDYGVEELASMQPGVPWREIADMRNVLAHRYLGVDIELTWEVVECHLAPLQSAIEAIARQLGVTVAGGRAPPGPP
jgi:uncharacterized protein with HEPN domain